MREVRPVADLGESRRAGSWSMPKPLYAADLEHVLRHTSGLWPALDGARLFITGGTGFFGIWLLESLTYAIDRLGLNVCATILTRRPDEFRARAPHLGRHPSLDWLGGDVRDFVFPAGNFTHVIHAATDSNNRRGNVTPLECFDIVVAGTRRVLEFASAAGVRNLLFISSGAVYGRHSSGLTHVSEDFGGGPDTLIAASAYAEGKRAAEHLCAIYHEQIGIAPKIARCFAFVGPHLPLDAHFAVGNFIRDALVSDTIIVKGDGSAYRSYLYSADLIVWLWTILVRGVPMRAYNVGSDAAVSIADLARTVAACRPGGCQVRIEQSPSDSPAQWYVPDISRARSELGLDVWHNLCLSIDKTMAWHAEASGP